MLSTSSPNWGQGGIPGDVDKSKQGPGGTTAVLGAVPLTPGPSVTPIRYTHTLLCGSAEATQSS